MTAALPCPTEGGFQPFAVATPVGPHVTMQAGTVLAGRYWTTTSRSSYKAAMIRRLGRAGVLLRGDDGRVRAATGRATLLDPRDPTTALDAPGALPFAGLAVAKVAVSQLSQLAGYVEAARAVPRGWWPDRRVIVVVRLDHVIELDGDDVVSAPDSAHSQGAGSGPVLDPEPAAPSAAGIDALDRRVASVFAGDRRIHAGFLSAAGPVVLPARWDDDRRVVVSWAALEAGSVDLPGPACVVGDDSADRRPDRKLGAMLRGSASVVGLTDRTAHLALVTDRVTTWDGFDSGTRSVA